MPLGRLCAEKLHGAGAIAEHVLDGCVRREVAVVDRRERDAGVEALPDELVVADLRFVTADEAAAVDVDDERRGMPGRGAGGGPEIEDVARGRAVGDVGVGGDRRGGALAERREGKEEKKNETSEARAHRR